MSIFHLILISVPLLTLAWLGWVCWRLRGLPAARWWIPLMIGGALLLVATYLWVVGYRIGLLESGPHSWLHALLLLWVIVFLPFVALPTMGAAGILHAARAVTRRVTGWLAPAEAAAVEPAASEAPARSRREFLRTGVLALPMVGTFGATAISIPRKTHFRIRTIDVPVANLPAALDGLAITHLSDTHVGKFTRGRVLRELAEATNRLKSDLILVTGDLIDHTLADLPEALDMIEAMDPRLGLFMVEGNHDLFEGVEEFAAGVRARGVPLLRDHSRRLRAGGHPVEILGLSWGRSDDGHAAKLDHMARRADPDAFPILLAHHPHAFDAAAARGIPLTLAGHTHGGQLMITPGIGPGPLLYRYWSGLYQNQDRRSSLVVSNGAGNWFPLRTAAPAEILKLTLRRA